MSKKSLLGIDLTEWKALSGLSDPYSLELAKISAEAGVPKISPMTEARLDVKPEDQSKDQKRLGLIKKQHRKLRKGGEGSKISGSFRSEALEQLMTQSTEDGEQMVFPYDAYLEAFLEDQGASLYEFNMLMDVALENDDFDLQAELLAIEEMLDEALGAALAGAAKAVGGAVKTGAKAVGGAVKKGAQFAVKKAGEGAGALASAGKAGFQAGMKGAGNAAKAAAPGATPDAGDKPAAAPEPTAAAPTPNTTGAAPGPQAAPAATPGAAPGGGTPAAPQAQTAGGAAPSQPGQTTPAAPAGGAKKKKSSFLGGVGKVIGGLAGAGKSIVKGAAKGVGQVAGGVKKGYAGEDIEYWEEFLGEEGFTVDEYMMVVEHAYEIGDAEMIEELHRLDEIFGSKRRKAAAAEKHAQGMAAIKKGVGIMKTRGKKAVDQANSSGRSTPDSQQQRVYQIDDKQAANESVNKVMDKQMQLMGYTDEHINSLYEGE
jgi:hypothetical protein